MWQRPQTNCIYRQYQAIFWKGLIFSEGFSGENHMVSPFIKCHS